MNGLDPDEVRRSVLARLCAAALLVGGICAPAVGVGQGTNSPSEVQEKSSGEEGGTSETESGARPPAANETSIHGGWLVIISYIVLWLGLLAYVASLGFRQRRLVEELDDLEREMDRALGAASDDD